MADLSKIPEHAEVIGADGVHLGTVDHVDGDRIKLTRTDSSDGRHHYVSVGLVAGVEDGKIRLSATAENALLLEDEDGEDEEDEEGEEDDEDEDLAD